MMSLATLINAHLMEIQFINDEESISSISSSEILALPFYEPGNTDAKVSATLLKQPSLMLK